MTPTPNRRATLALIALLWAAACTQQARTLDELLPLEAEVTLAPITDARGNPEGIRADGLAADQLLALRRLAPGRDQWRRLLEVRPAGDDDEEAALPGDYEITTTAILFRPKEPFQRGREYVATWVAGTGDAPRLVLAPKRPGPQSTTKVVAIYPSGDVLPVNLRRLHIEFDGPMTAEIPPDAIRLVLDDTGEIAPLALSEEAVQWNDAHTRLTLRLDAAAAGAAPGGSVLLPGRRYRLHVSRALRDRRGRPLRAGIEKLFLVDAPDRTPPDPERWTIKAPTIDRAPLVVDFPSPVDVALVEEALEVRSRDGRPIAGESRVSNGEKRWTFQPARHWREGDYVLRVATALEDPAGNAAGAAGAQQNGSAAAALPFEVKLGLMGKTIR